MCNTLEGVSISEIRSIHQSDLQVPYPTEQGKFATSMLADNQHLSEFEVTLA